MTNPTRALVVSPHPDDESIGCGGTLRSHALAGDVVHAVFLTSGEQGGHGRSPDETGTLREREARDAAQVLGLTHIDFWREPDGALRATPRLAKRLAAVIRELRPTVVYAPHGGEMHPDHKAAFRLVRRALRQLIVESPRFPVPEVWLYEVWTPVRRIDQIIDISPFLDAKLAAIRAHRSQCDVMRFDEAARGLARYRGEMHLWPGGDYAEAFREWQPNLPADSRPHRAASRPLPHPAESHGGNA